MMPSRYTSQRQPGGCGRLRRAAGHPARQGADRAGGGRLSPACWRRFSPSRAPDIDRGEHPVAHPRRDPDGDLQQVGADGADHRQQVGDVGRLRHALRRHVRRLLGAQGRLQDHRVRAVRAGATRSGPTARSGRPARSSRSASSPSRRRPSCGRTRRTRIRCRPTTCSTRSWTGWSSRTCRRASWSAGASPPTRSGASRNLLDLAEYKRRQAPPGVKITRKAFGRDRRYPITNAFRRIGLAALSD